MRAVIIATLLAAPGPSGRITVNAPSSVNGAGTSSQPMTAPSYTATVASGSNAFGCSVNGERVDFGSGASDYCSSDGTTVTCAGPWTFVGNTNASGMFQSNNGNSTAFNASAGGGQYALGTHTFITFSAPTISSGFGTSPSVTTSNGTVAFTINVGTGGAATSGVIGLPTATNGWVCVCQDITTTSATVFVTKQTASSTTTCTVGNFNTSAVAAAWAASDILHCIAMGR